MYKHLIHQILLDRATNEEKVLRIICRLHIGNRLDDDKKTLKQLIQNSNLNWDTLYELVFINQLNNIVSDVLKNNALDSFIPKHIQIKLISLSLATKKLAKKHSDQSRHWLKKLYQQRFKFVVMKTYALRNTLFKNRFIKSPSDLDLLISPYDFFSISEYLLKNGFKYFPPPYKKTFSAIPNNLFYTPKRQEIFQRGSYIIELHTSVVDTFPFSAIPIITTQTNGYISQHLYSNICQVSFRGIKTYIFKSTELFFSLFLHLFYQHNCQGAATHYEIACFVKKYKREINWKKVEKLSADIGFGQYYIWFLMLLNDIYPEILPPKIIQKIHKEQSSLSLCQRCIYRLMKYKTFHPTKFTLDGKMEYEKEWYWAAITNNVGKLVVTKMRNKLLPH